MARPDPPEDDDAALFRDAIGEVRRMEDAPPPPRKAPPRPRARMAERDELDARSEFQRGLDALEPLAAGDTLSHRRDALPARAFQRLKRGQYAAQDELDLHGATAVQAEGLLRRFLADAALHEYGCVRIIHGKGTGALRAAVQQSLKKNKFIKSFRLGVYGEGEDGVTIAEFR